MASLADGYSGMDDDLFDYDIGNGELDITIPDPEPLPDVAGPGGSKKKSDDLGLDEELEIKKRRVTVKLDEERLLSNKGLPRLRREAPKQLKFKGKKGYEYKDAARLLSYYQLWADDLFKKAKFRDTLEIIEKLGHHRRVRTYREEWIDEARHRKTDAADMRGLHDRRGEGGEGGDEDGEENDDELYSLPTDRPAPRAQVSKDATASQDANALFLGDVPDDSDEDMGGFNDGDFEALMAAEREKAVRGSRSGSAPALPEQNSSNTDAMGNLERIGNGKNSLFAPKRDEFDEFEDDLEAMEAMEAIESNRMGKALLQSPQAKPFQNEFDDFEDDLGAMRAAEAMERTRNKRLPQAPPPQDDFEFGFVDEMELLEEMEAQEVMGLTAEKN